MFRKLLLKLTFLNASVIALLFLTLISGVYFYAQNEINRRSIFFLSRMAAEINAGYPPPFLSSSSRRPAERGASPAPSQTSLPGPPSIPPQEEEMPRPIIFYVQTDSSDKIIFSSEQQPLSAERLSSLLQNVQTRPLISGRILFDNTSYFFLVTPRSDNLGSLFIFQNFDREYNVFWTIMESLIIIGFLCFIFSLFGSLFLARSAMRPIRQSWNKQRDFLADVSHELRTPLAVIHANLDVIRSNSEEQVFSQKQWLDNIGESVGSMASLVDSLLFLARIDSQQHPIDKKTFALDKAIANVLEQFQPMAAAKKIQLVSEINPGINLMGDEARLKQVLGILLDNALRHTPSGGKIQVLLQQVQRNAQLTVRDTGEGISREHLSKIFDRFYQADPARNKGGHGLGLAIAKCIVETHAGAIQALSQPGEGAAFLIRLPLN